MRVPALLAVCLAIPAPCRGAEGLVTADDRPANALVHEASPYLQAHAHDPVPWLPWGAEALRKAREEDKPIFLSIGYSTCHWCHVMQHESFSDDAVAAALAAGFVPIKVDREERPDIDEIYITAVQLLRRQAGWPLTVWLTPELEPFAGGTYMPRDQLLEQLHGISEAWRDRRALVEAGAHQVAGGVRRVLAARRTAGVLGDDVLTGAVAKLATGWDEEHGGWGRPAFPREATVLFLLDRWQVSGDAQALAMATQSLTAMQRGGIHDQLGGGFHRYTVDAAWTVPHFEKMLYTQAWLGRCYVEAWRLTGDPEYRRTAEDILTYVTRDLADPAGAFRSAESADSPDGEGVFYLWTPGEIASRLGAKDAALAEEWWGVSGSGNFREAPGHTVLTARLDPARFARAHDLTPAALRRGIEAWSTALLESRATRRRPGLDDKVLADWNGMMIGTLARAGAVLHEPAWTAAAERAATFVLTKMRDDEGRLVHAWRGRPMSGPAFLDDDAALADGLIELADATGDARWLDEAVQLYRQARRDFRDPDDGAFWSTGPQHESLLARSKDGYDGAVPSANALIAWDAVRLWRRTGDASLAGDAAAVFGAFSAELQRAQGAALMLRALQAWREGEAGPVARDDSGVLVARVAAPDGEAAPGNSVEVALALDVAPGWHVGAAAPRETAATGDEGPSVAAAVRATMLSVEPPWTLSDVAWPSGRSVRLPSAGGRVSLYGGTTAWTARLAVPPRAKPGPAVAHLRLTAQACDDSRCLAPTILRLEVPLAVRVASAPP